MNSPFPVPGDGDGTTARCATAATADARCTHETAARRPYDVRRERERRRTKNEDRIRISGDGNNHTPANPAAGRWLSSYTPITSQIQCSWQLHASTSLRRGHWMPTQPREEERGRGDRSLCIPHSQSRSTMPLAKPHDHDLT